jgi:hypothetical protein
MANKLPAITITGVHELKELLDGFTDKEILPAVQQGMRFVGTKTTRDAKRHLSKGRGLLSGAFKRSLGVRKIKTYRREGRVVMYLGPRRGYHVGTHTLGNKRITKTGYRSPKNPNAISAHDPFSIGHLIEFGHVKVLWGRRTGGRVRAIPSLGPAVDLNRPVFVSHMRKKLHDVLVKARARRGK